MSPDEQVATANQLMRLAISPNLGESHGAILIIAPTGVQKGMFSLVSTGMKQASVANLLRAALAAMDPRMDQWIKENP